MQRRVGERAATPCVTPTINHGGGSVMVWEGGSCQLQSRGFVLDEEQIESDWLLQHTAASSSLIWNRACSSRIYTFSDKVFVTCVTLLFPR